MTRKFKKPNYEEMLKASISLEEVLPANHLARFVVDVVAQLDLGLIYARYAPTGGEAIAPEILLGLLFYGYPNGVFSSRKIEKATYEREKVDFTPLLKAITTQTGIPILLEGVYRWLVFPPSRRDPRVPVPNRYFGAFTDGEIKARGIAVRRWDTCAFVAETQWRVLEILGQVDDPVEKYDEAREFLQKQIRALRKGRIPPEKLVVMQKLTRELVAYRVPSPAARAAQQLVEAGKEVHPGQVVMRFVHTRGKPGVWALDGEKEFEMRRVDVERYCLLLERETETVLEAITEVVTTKSIYPFVFVSTGYQYNLDELFYPLQRSLKI